MWTRNLLQTASYSQRQSQSQLVQQVRLPAFWQCMAWQGLSCRDTFGMYQLYGAYGHQASNKLQYKAMKLLCSVCASHCSTCLQLARRPRSSVAGVRSRSGTTGRREGRGPPLSGQQRGQRKISPWWQRLRSSGCRDQGMMHLPDPTSPMLIRKTDLQVHMIQSPILATMCACSRSW